MSGYEVLLFVHVLGGFAVVAGLVCLSPFALVEGGGVDAVVSRLAGLGIMLFNIGGFLTLVLGIWLALDRDEYDITDGWIIAAIVVWLVTGVAGGRLAGSVAARRAGAQSPVPADRLRAIYAAAAAATLVLLFLMIFKPGA